MGLTHKQVCEYTRKDVCVLWNRGVHAGRKGRPGIIIRKEKTCEFIDRCGNTSGQKCHAKGSRKETKIQGCLGPPPPPHTFERSAPRSHNREPEYCLLSQGNPVRKNTQQVLVIYIFGCPPYLRDLALWVCGDPVHSTGQLIVTWKGFGSKNCEVTKGTVLGCLGSIMKTAQNVRQRYESSSSLVWSCSATRATNLFWHPLPSVWLVGISTSVYGGLIVGVKLCVCL
jgi:hypothetical protein